MKMLEKTSQIDKIEIVANGVVQVRQLNQILDNGVAIAKNYHRWMIVPGQDYSDQEEQVRAICAAVHTNEVIAAWNAKLTETTE
jgi:hypothetical protein